MKLPRYGFRPTSHTSSGMCLNVALIPLVQRVTTKCIIEKDDSITVDGQAMIVYVPQAITPRTHLAVLDWNWRLDIPGTRPSMRAAPAVCLPLLLLLIQESVIRGIYTQHRKIPPSYLYPTSQDSTELSIPDIARFHRVIYTRHRKIPPSYLYPTSQDSTELSIPDIARFHRVIYTRHRKIPPSYLYPTAQDYTELSIPDSAILHRVIYTR
ncbi:hypothetical protein J6590_064549 [Homalodisca vitripennis]|nr:hypothetical protein J6590_064549 [Homalodisca vitripennis]